MEVIEIKSSWNGALLYSGEHMDVKEAVEAAVKGGADLARADLSGANLARADLNGADLSGADLSGAYLVRANMIGAYLNGANLNGANLTCAYLNGADLSGAYLNGADLSGANLARANLNGAYLDGAKVGAGEDGARLAGSRPIVQIGPIGSCNDWLLAFWCGDSGMRVSTGCQQQISEERFLERLAEAHGAGERVNIHAENYLAALAFAKHLLKAQL